MENGEVGIVVLGLLKSYPIDYGTTWTRLGHREIKINLVAYLIISKHNIHVNINE